MTDQNFSAHTVSEHLVSLEIRVGNLADALQRHVENEEKAIKILNDRLTVIERCVSKWYGIALGVSLTVSAIWAAVLAVLSFFKR